MVARVPRKSGTRDDDEGRDDWRLTSWPAGAAGDGLPETR
jgi:hypothetical protein